MAKGQNSRGLTPEFVPLQNVFCRINFNFYVCRPLELGCFKLLEKGQLILCKFMMSLTWPNTFSVSDSLCSFLMLQVYLLACSSGLLMGSFTLTSGACVFFILVYISWPLMTNVWFLFSNYPFPFYLL